MSDAASPSPATPGMVTMTEAPITGERANWSVVWRVDKYRGEVTLADDGRTIRETPYEVVEGKGNLLLNAGISLMLDLLIGAGGTTYSNANAYIGVGDSSTSASASQTDLQAATNKLRKAMDATYPSRSAQTLTFRSTFGGSDANFAWNEWIIANAAAAGTALNRKAESLGTKASGTWVFTVTVTLS